MVLEGQAINISQRQWLKVVVLILAGLGLLFMSTQTVEAKDLAGERYTGAYSTSDPLSWNQCNHSYSGDIYPVWGETYCSSSCGAHSLMWMLMKSGVWGMDKTAKDAWTFFESNGWAYAGSGGYVSMGSGAPVTENGKKIELMDTISGAGLDSIKGWLREIYDKGYYAILNVPGHLIGFDYIDADGDPVMLDSAELCKYLECIGNRWGHSYTAWAYKIEGAKSNGPDAINFWEGDVASGSSSSGGDSNNPSNGSGSSNVLSFDDREECYKTPIVDYCADPYTWESHLVEYEENRNTPYENKGVDKEDGFLNWLFR